MVTTRRQAGADMPTIKPLTRIDRQRLARAAKTTPTAKTVVQKRRQANEAAIKPKEALIQTRRHALSTAPQLGNHVLFIFVGEPGQLVTIHSELLPEATRLYIHEKCQGQQIYQLPDEDINIAHIYRLYLYTGRIYSISSADQDRPDNGRREVHADAEWMRLAHGYLFGVTVRDEKFANACITAIIDKMEEIDRYPTGIASEVYTYTQEDDALRKLIVDVHVFRGLGQWVFPPHDDADGPREFLQDVIGGLAAAGAEEGFYADGLKMPWEGAKGRCKYHLHAMTARCEW